jgi:heat shock protein HslJ
MQISPPVGTGMLCDEAVNEQASDYLAALTQSATYQVSGNRLTLLGSGGQRLVEYVR